MVECGGGAARSATLLLTLQSVYDEVCLEKKKKNHRKSYGEVLLINCWKQDLLKSHFMGELIVFRCKPIYFFQYECTIKQFGTALFSAELHIFCGLQLSSNINFNSSISGKCNENHDYTICIDSLATSSLVQFLTVFILITFF